VNRLKIVDFIYPADLKNVITIIINVLDSWI